MNAIELQSRVSAIKPWFYEMDLGNGVKTPGMGSAEILAARADIYFGMGIEGASILDVGAWDGFYSFEAERRGASRVLAVDKFCWGGGGSGNRAAFELAREALGSSVEDKIIDIDETNVENVGPFDIVLFNGIVYHIKDPLHAIAQAAKIARHVLSVETYLDMLESPRPSMVFFPGDTTNPHGPQNGWGMNSSLGHALLKSLGFETVLEFPTPDAPSRRSIFLAFKTGHPYSDFVRKHANASSPRLTTATAVSSPAGDLGVIVDTVRSAIVEGLATQTPPLLGWRNIMEAVFKRLAAYFT